jgi:hypothetical protein
MILEGVVIRKWDLPFFMQEGTSYTYPLVDKDRNPVQIPVYWQENGLRCQVSLRDGFAIFIRNI